MTARLLKTLCCIAFLGQALSPAAAQTARTITAGSMLLGDWQNEASGMSLHCLPHKQVILEMDITKNGETTRNLLGSYRAQRRGVWDLTVKDALNRTHSYTLVFQDSHRLLLHQGADAPLVFQRSGIRFDQIDRDGDGWITKAEAKGTPLQYRYDEFVTGRDRQVDRLGFEKFLEKYPHLGSKK